MPALSVVVVSWNTRALLAECLRALHPDLDAGRAEVRVVDNDSSDGSAEMVAERFPWVTLEQPGRNLGFGAAANLGARAAVGGEWIVVANADVTPHPGAIAALAAEPRPGVGIVAPRLLTPAGATEPSVHPFPTLGRTLAFTSGLTGPWPELGRRLALDGRWDPELARRVDWAHGALLCVRRACWEQIGGFDERQWMYAEDLDLCWRAAQAGWSTRYEPAAQVVHQGAASTRQAFGDAREQRAQASAYVWLARRRGPLEARAVALANLAGVAGRLVLARGPRARARLRGYARMHATGLRSRAALERMTENGPR
ncbi:MAG TPA: glycosyltransferase family 2 protein [Solirubrobacteraceae bacterium]|jgi:GT2 family glycosyltransferase|nr:glycosyltransferase family 2 protein [Solirubrobacteraceae bacterium]